ncbi:hypothetical protein EDD22DRAFT_851413 [Suillus occidentalis]|nr:hypothetical protein EDD22DRAFT_851413 [Suillus occidentalis]
MSGWGDQPQSRQGDDQYTTEYTPPAPHTPSPAFDFPFHYQFEPYRTDHSSQLQSSWAPSQSQARPDDTTSFPAGPSHQAALWSLQQPWEGHSDQLATLGSLQPYHHPHHDGPGTAAITAHTENHPQSSGPPSLQDQLICPRPHRLSDLVLPEYISAWRLQVDAIPATDVAASHATLNPSSSDNSGSVSAMPIVTDPSHHTFNNVIHHSNIISSPHRVRAPNRSTRSNRRNTKLTTTKRIASKTSIAPKGLDIIPYGIEDFLNECNKVMKETAFARSLLPTPEALKEMIDFSWDTVTQDQTDGALQSWAFDKLCGSDKYRVTKLEPVIMEILNELKVAVRPFIYNAYNVAFDPNVMLNESYVISRRANVGHLLTNDEFLYGQLWVRSRNQAITRSDGDFVQMGPARTQNGKIYHKSLCARDAPVFTT